ncbi:response regulator transcription factor [Kitasatospora mediocidica]|uniref:response regulator transcription factor n=1 Tax=Kitasatospora mediocidica TaxID=58352 RepID=UPI000564D7C2|nr:response regulator transcription factor [Kitasatospora mediocidica]
MTHVLIVEPDAGTRAGLQGALQQLRYRVSAAESGQDGMSRVIEDAPDVVILALDLPDMSGLKVLRILRSVVRLPIVAAVARADESLAVQALRAGADDSLEKPFSVNLVDARLTALMRRCGAEEPPEVMTVGGLVIDVQAHTATLGDRVLDLRPMEFRLLAHLAANAGRVVSKAELRERVWENAYTTNKTIDVHLCWLRRQLGETAAQPRYLGSVRRVGVSLSAPDVEA